MNLGKKAKLTFPKLAWIPGYGPFIIAFKASRMHWWPWLLLIGVIMPYPINLITGIIFMIFTTLWQWKLLELVRKPGWWALLGLIPGVWLIILWLVVWRKK